MGDLIGRRFGRLTVISQQGSKKIGKAWRRMWLCKCDCGKETTVPTINLTSGNTKSCGCLRPQSCSKNSKVHGGYGERLYYVWRSMKGRCNNQNDKRYDRYGGRGISVCEQWNKSYASFRDWALNNGYDEAAEYGKCTLDRIDNSGNYCPENCRWVDMAVQSRNRG